MLQIVGECVARIDNMLIYSWGPESWLALAALRLLQLVLVTVILIHLIHLRRFYKLGVVLSFLWLYYFVKVYLSPIHQQEATIGLVYVHFCYVLLLIGLWRTVCDIKLGNVSLSLKRKTKSPLHPK